MRVLFLTHRLPYAPNRGDRMRSFHLLRRMRMFAEVDLVSLVHDDEEATHVEEARPLATTVTAVRVPRVRNLVRSALALPTPVPLSHVMLDGPDLQPAVERIVRDHPPDVVLAFCTGIAHAVARPPLDRFPLVLDMVDVDSAKWAALASTTAPPRSWIYAREARLLSKFEIEIARRAVVTLLTTRKERATLDAMAPGVAIEVLSSGVDVESLRPPGPPADSVTVVFCGVMNYPPNEEAAIWIAREVWPAVRRARPDARLELVGSYPTRQVQALASPAQGIVVTGHVPDVRPHLWGAAVAAAPLQTARGVQNKVLEAVAAGLPTIVTPIVFEGLPDQVRPACVVAGDAGAFAGALVASLGQPAAERRRNAGRADVAAISWDRLLEPVERILRDAIQRHN
ncbi:MAG TPA: TIGR03087 family PEP-CTERM/XrtA system glycosyltransferase [Vicinamibacterales bacterium]|nr:TIGR03087 family PEP-CTERM/XrtA system glycosyltransferase [Vicinamibacterales bacterium]